jgi:hypothetical protein
MNAQVNLHPETLSRLIADEIYKAMGFSKEIWLRRFIEPLIKRPVNTFSEICARFDSDVARYDFREAASRILPNFVNNIRVFGAERIPLRGPLLIVSNHPGTYDSLIIAANIPRTDLKIMAGNIPFLKNMPATQNHILHTSIDTQDRMMVLRKSIRHLLAGGSLLIFGSGGIDPEPTCMPGSEVEIDRWSPSIEFLIRKVPGLNSLAAIVSGVLSPKYINHPFTIFRKSRRDRQRISEFLQVIRQIVSPGKLQLSPQVSFADPVKIQIERMIQESNNVFENIKVRAKQLLVDHQIPGLNHF